MKKDCCNFGTYECSVKLKECNLYSKPQYCDKCISKEIETLHEQGIKTVASCCGHGKIPHTIAVYDEYFEKMLELGYKIDDKEVNSFHCKTILTTK
jgi:hypothetical protein